MKKFISISYAYFLIAVFSLISCRSVSRDVVKEEALQKEISKSETTAEQETKTTTETNSETSSKFDLTQFSITPQIAGKLTDFTFNYNGQIISGQTSGILNFSNEKKEEQKSEKAKTEIFEKWKVKTKTYTKTLTKTYNFYKTVTKTVVYSWQFWVLFPLCTILIWELLKRAWKVFVKSNIYLKLINRLTKLR